GKRRYLELASRAAAAARRFRPEVVHAHFLVPSGLIAALASRAPLVVTAHGRDVRNVGAVPGVATATRVVVRRAAAIVAVSDYLRRELEAKIPAARHKTHVLDSGVDLERFRGLPAPNGPPRYLCVGSSTPPTTTPSSRPSAPPRAYPARTRPPVRRRRPTTSTSRRAAWRRSSSEPLEVGEPELDERPDRVLQAGLARERQSPLVALPRLR